MGYELHITRSEDWVDSESNPITMSEWLECASGGSRLSVGGSITFGQVETPAYYLTDLGPENGPSLFWHGGEVRVGGAPDEAIGHLVAIADDLGASLIGDEGETYP